MSYIVDNAIIMCAGTSSRFAPLSYERPKGLITVKGEILIERQIEQLKEVGINEIILVVGYKKEMFYYLKDKFNVKIIENPFYEVRNNNSSIYVVKDYLKNSYICSSDNYFNINPFEKEIDESYYSTVYADGDTAEWCVSEDNSGYISEVKIGGKNSWFMLGHTFWSEEFSNTFKSILEQEYNLPETADKLWEKIYMSHLDVLKMKARHYSQNDIFEFDTLDELRVFDTSYINNTQSVILKDTSKTLKCKEKDIVNIHEIKSLDNKASGFSFYLNNKKYTYTYENKELRSC